MPEVTRQRPPAPTRNGPRTSPPTTTRTSPSKGGARSAWDLADYIKLLLYGRSATGKTTTWATFPGPITAFVCSGGKNPGEMRSINTPEYRKKITPLIIDSSAQLREMVAAARESPPSTLVLDHASGLQDLTLREVLGVDELPAQKSWGLATQQQYGQSTGMCKDIIREMLNLPCNVVIVAQERTFGEDESADGLSIQRPTIGPAVTPSLAAWLNPAVDYILQAYIRPVVVEKTVKVAGRDSVQRTRGQGVEYCARTEPHDVYITKFRVPKGTAVPECIVDPEYDKIKALLDGTAA